LAWTQKPKKERLAPEKRKFPPGAKVGSGQDNLYTPQKEKHPQRGGRQKERAPKTLNPGGKKSARWKKLGAREILGDRQKTRVGDDTPRLWKKNPWGKNPLPQATKHQEGGKNLRRPGGEKKKNPGQNPRGTILAQHLYIAPRGSAAPTGKPKCSPTPKEGTPAQNWCRRTYGPHTTLK